MAVFCAIILTWTIIGLFLFMVILNETDNLDKLSTRGSVVAIIICGPAAIIICICLVVLAYLIAWLESL